MNRFTLSAVVLLVLTNAFVLAGVAYNRSGAPLFNIELTERELDLRSYYRRDRENSGTTLTLMWQTLNTETNGDYFYTYRQNPPWLDESKLAELGFDLERLKRQRENHNYRSSDYTVEAYLVFEYQGETYKKNIRNAEQRLANLRIRLSASPEDQVQTERLKIFEREVRKLKHSHSRLYAIDAGPDKELLLEKYAGKSNHLLLRGKIGVWWQIDNFQGYIRQVLSEQIHVPLPHSRFFSNLKGASIRHASGENEILPRYKVMLNFGQRLEPWVESVAPYSTQ